MVNMVSLKFLQPKLYFFSVKTEQNTNFNRH